jgi:hypothetical protein
MTVGTVRGEGANRTYNDSKLTYGPACNFDLSDFPHSLAGRHLIF